MTEPTPPYYYHQYDDTYHWELLCPENHWPFPGWKKSDVIPDGLKKCKECESIDHFYYNY